MSFLESPPFPLCPSFGFRGGPEFSVTVVASGSGIESRNLNWSQARRSYVVTVGPRADVEYELLLEHFEVMGAKGIGFRFKDPKDWKSCPPYETPKFSDQILGTGDGATAQFQLIKTRRAGAIARVRNITKPVSGTVLVGASGSNLGSGWSVNTATGIVTFNVAPAMSVPLTWGGEFDVPVRYDNDKLENEIIDKGADSCSFTLVELKLTT